MDRYVGMLGTLGGYRARIKRISYLAAGHTTRNKPASVLAKDCQKKNLALCEHLRTKTTAPPPPPRPGKLLMPPG